MTTLPAHWKKPALVISLVSCLAACGGSGSSGSKNDDSNGDTTPINDSAQASAPSHLSTTIGEVLVDARNLTLYTFDNDTQENVSTCNADCTQSWPPLIASDTATASAPFSIFERDDNSRQWAFKGDPLYNFSGDNQSGDINGENINGVWHVSRPDPFAVSGIKVTANEMVLTPSERVERDGFTLYTFDNDNAGVSNCTDGCAETWPPLLAEAGAKAEPPFTLATRDATTMQWALNGRPLYLFSGDNAAGDENGDGVGNTWFTARITPVAVIETASQGRVFTAHGDVADGSGGTTSAKTGFVVYTFDEDSANTSTCFDDCADTWPPLYAQETDVSMGDFSVIDRDENGTTRKQWALRGEPLYFFVGDLAPGDTNGVYGTWHAAKP